MWQEIVGQNVDGKPRTFVKDVRDAARGISKSNVDEILMYP